MLTRGTGWHQLFLTGQESSVIVQCFSRNKSFPTTDSFCNYGVHVRSPKSRTPWDVEFACITVSG